MTSSDIEAAIEYRCEILKFFPASSSGGLAHLKNIATPCPVSIQVYPGNASDPNTAADPQLADYGWISAPRSNQINKLVQTEDFQSELFDRRALAEITSEDFPGERLVVCRNPALARKRHHTCQKMIEATEAVFEKIQLGTTRKRNPYQGRDNIARCVEREGSCYHMLKHFKPHFTETTFTFEPDEQNITCEARLDGLYITRARNIREEDMDAPDLVANYKNLAKVESAFRRIKTTAFLIRPNFYYEI